MKRIFLLTAALVATVTLNAQLRERYSMKAGDNITEVFGSNGIYRFPKFTEGTFLLKDGTKSRAMFNYNMASDEIQYITSKSDTMAIGVPDDLVYVTIGENTQFIYNNKSYLEILTEAQSNKLAKKIKLNVEKEKKGGYGESAPTSSQDQVVNFYTGTQLFQLTHDVVITKTTSFYWLDAKNNPQPATKKSSMKLVSRDKQSKLETFIEENKTDFNSEDDLRKLLAYAGSL